MMLWLLLCQILTVPAAAASMAKAWESFDGGDYRTARRIWQEFADQENTEAMVALAGMAETGVGQQPDPELARAYYRSAARLGNADGMQNLAVMMECGHGGPKDIEAAMTWYARAALSGMPWATRQLARLGSSRGGTSTAC